MVEFFGLHQSFLYTDFSENLALISPKPLVWILWSCFEIIDWQIWKNVFGADDIPFLVQKIKSANEIKFAEFEIEPYSNMNVGLFASQFALQPFPSRTPSRKARTRSFCPAICYSSPLPNKSLLPEHHFRPLFSEGSKLCHWNQRWTFLSHENTNEITNALSGQVSTVPVWEILVDEFGANTVRFMERIF